MDRLTTSVLIVLTSHSNERRRLFSIPLTTIVSPGHSWIQNLCGVSFKYTFADCPFLISEEYCRSNAFLTHRWQMCRAQAIKKSQQIYVQSYRSSRGVGELFTVWTISYSLRPIGTSQSEGASCWTLGSFRVAGACVGPFLCSHLYS